MFLYIFTQVLFFSTHNPEQLWDAALAKHGGMDGIEKMRAARAKRADMKRARMGETETSAEAQPKKSKGVAEQNTSPVCWCESGQPRVCYAALLDQISRTFSSPCLCCCLLPDPLHDARPPLRLRARPPRTHTRRASIAACTTLLLCMHGRRYGLARDASRVSRVT